MLSSKEDVGFQTNPKDYPKVNSLKLDVIIQREYHMENTGAGHDHVKISHNILRKDVKSELIREREGRTHRTRRKVLQL